MSGAEFGDKSYLVIDDFADMRSVLRSILRSLGATRVDQASDGAEAVSRLERKHYDVILCDYNLGNGKNGQQVLEEARYRQLFGVDCIFIMITAENTREMVMSAVEYVPDSYLTKPLTKELLKTRLTKLFERKADLAAVNKAMMAKDQARAIAELDTLIAARPKHLPELVKLKAEICLNSNRYDEALAIYEQALAVRDLPWAYLGTGKALYRQKKYEQAQTVFKHLLELDRNLIAAYDWLAKTQVALKEFEEAEQTLASAVRLSPRGVSRQQQLGELALNNGHGETAETAFQQAVGLSRHSILNHPALFAGLAKSKSANQKHDEALQVTRDLSKTFGETPEAVLYRATATATIKRNQGDLAAATAALAAAEQALRELGPSAPPRLGLEMVTAHARLGNQEQADALLRTVIANNHDDEEFLNEVLQSCRESGMGENAGTAIHDVRQEVVKTNNAGVRLIQKGQFDDAIRLLCKAADEMPGNKTISLNAAKAGIMKMEKMGPNVEGVRMVRHYVERVQSMAPDDWRLADVAARLQQIAIKL